MSYERNNYRGGGGRRRYHEQDDRNRREIVESPQEKLKNAIIKLGEVDPIEEIAQLERHIRQVTPVVPAPTILSNITEAFRIGVTEEPFKIPYYAALLRLLHDKGEEDVAEGDGPTLGRQILEDFWKGVQAYMDKQAWKETRSCVHFFAHLTVAKLVSAESMVTLLQSFTAVLEEFGVSPGRARQAAICAAEGLMIAGTSLRPAFKHEITEIITAIETYSETTNTEKWMVHPMLPLHTKPASSGDSSSNSKWLSHTMRPVQNTLGESVDEILDLVLSALKTLDGADFTEDDESYPRPYSTYSELDPAKFTPFAIPSVLVPPEVIELDSGNPTEAVEQVPLKKDAWPVFLLRLFDNDVTPDPKTPSGYAIRTAILSIIDIFEVNRKECARILLEYPKWIQAGTFRPKPGAPAATQTVPIEGRNWQLESTVVEAILGLYFVLPEATHKSVYYMCLIADLCKLSPSTVGPAVGKSIRRLYNGLSDGLDVHVSRRFAEWFATHMSNFGFQWVWKEWIPDLALDLEHPRRTFIRTAVEFEIRLAYYDRVAKTLPEEMQEAEAAVLPAQAPGPDYDYEDSSNPHHDAAQAVLTLLRGRTKAEDVISYLDTLRSTLEASEEEDLSVDRTIRFIATQSLLHIGSRSFSHLLNAIERYLPLLRYISTGGVSTSSGSGNAEAKFDILTSVAAFWKYNSQLVGIVFDKLMQYQIVDPTDIVDWTFAQAQNVKNVKAGAGGRGTSHIGAFEWDILKAALDKANGRVLNAKRKLAVLRKEDDEHRARENAGMDVDGEPKPDEPSSIPENPTLTVAVKGFASLTKEQKAVLSRALEGFVGYLAPSDNPNHNPHVHSVILEETWTTRSDWNGDQWRAWESWGWYRHFCRAYAPYLRPYSNTLSTVSFAKFEGVEDPSVELLLKMFNVATGEYT